MEENSEQNKERHVEIVTSKDDKKCECWTKYLFMSLAAFFGAFLAVYFVTDSMMHRYFIPLPPPSMDNRDVDDFLRQQDRMMRDFVKNRPSMNPFMAGPVKVQTFQDDGVYKIIIDLKPFGGDEKNIKLDVTEYSVKISGKSDKKGKNGEKEISFMQSFSLPHKIDVDDVKTEKKGNDYIIILPIED